MIELSLYELALPIVGFFLGAAFIIMVYRMLGLGRGGRRDRRRRGGNHYYDDDDRGNYLPLILVLLVVGVALSYKFDLIKIQKDKPLTKQNMEIKAQKPRDRDDIPFEPQEKIEKRIAEVIDIETQSEVSEDPQSSTEAKPHCVRICVLPKNKNVEPRCQDLMDLGFSVFTEDRGNGTAIYIGPFESKSRAESVNLDNSLQGVIEPF